MRGLAWGALLILAMSSCVSPHDDVATGLPVERLCPGYSSSAIADGLPTASAVTDRDSVDAVRRAHAAGLEAQHPGIVDLSVGPGYLHAWEGDNGGGYDVSKVHSWAIIATLDGVDRCPGAGDVNLFVDGVPVLLSAVAGPSSKQGQGLSLTTVGCAPSDAGCSNRTSDAVAAECGRPNVVGVEVNYMPVREQDDGSLAVIDAGRHIARCP